MAPDGAGWPCLFIHIALAPVFKPFAPSMWYALMSVGQFVIWHSTATTSEATRRSTATKLPPPPLPLNVVTFACVYAVLLPLLIWVAAVVPFAVLLLFPPLWPLWMLSMGALPAVLMGALPFSLHMLERVCNAILAFLVPSLSRHGEKDTQEEGNTGDNDGDEENAATARSLLLKVFATIMLVCS